MYDVIVVGGGPAGLSAAIHSANFGLQTLVLEASEKVGGIATRARGIDNYPGFLGKISGLRLMEKMTRQAERKGAEIRTLEEVVSLSLNEDEKIVGTRKDKYQCKALILATGDGMRGLGMKWETWIGVGVAYCVECGMSYFEGKDVVIIGNVSSAVDEALRLTTIAKSVTLVNHANMIRINGAQRALLQAKNISLIEDSVGKEIKGKPPSKTLVLQHVDKSKTKKLKANIILVVGEIKPFVSVLRKSGIKTHRQCCIIVDEFGRTNIEGVFAAGGCASTVKDIIPACVGDGANVATCAHLYLAYKH